jgi:hypothetical protein
MMVAYALCQSKGCPRRTACGRHEGNGEPVSAGQEYLTAGPKLTEDAHCVYFFPRPAAPAGAAAPATPEATPHPAAPLHPAAGAAAAPAAHPTAALHAALHGPQPFVAVPTTAPAP